MSTLGPCIFRAKDLGVAMAAYLRKQGLRTLTTENGSRTRLVESLQTGQPVPLGVVMVQGEVTRLKGGSLSDIPIGRLETGTTRPSPVVVTGCSSLASRAGQTSPQPSTSTTRSRRSAQGDPSRGTKMAAGEGQYWMVEQRQ